MAKEVAARTEQLSLWYDTPLAKSIPNRSLNKGEMYIIVCIQQSIQEAVKRDEHNLSLDIDTATIAHLRGKRPRDVVKQCAEAVKTLSDNYFAQKIVGYREGELMTVGAFAMYSYIRINDDGVIHIEVNPRYEEYYRNFVASSPDLQIPAEFYLNSKSQYSYSLTNWIVATIYEMRQQNNEYGSKYLIHVSYDDIVKIVPPATHMTKGNYQERVLKRAIQDINKNIYSQIHIVDFSSTTAAGSKRIDGYNFDISIMPTKERPMFFEKPDVKAIDQDDTPSWEVLMDYMRRLGADESFVTYIVRKNYKVAIFKAILRVIVQPEECHTGAYLNRVFRNGGIADSIYSLCLQIQSLHPEHLDPIISGIIEKHEGKWKKAEEEKTNKEEDIDRNSEIYRRYAHILEKTKRS